MVAPCLLRSSLWSKVDIFKVAAFFSYSAWLHGLLVSLLKNPLTIILGNVYNKR